jgi:hypothetical protein
LLRDAAPASNAMMTITFRSGGIVSSCLLGDASCPKPPASLVSSSKCTRPITRRPIFHVRYAGAEVLIEIRTLSVVRGSLPQRVLALTLE